MSKDKYKVRNWSEYNEGLKQRGALTLWISEEALKEWRYSGKQQRGGQVVYSDLAIETCLTLRLIYHLPLRQTEGFVGSVFEQAHLEVPVPDSSTLCRRTATLRGALRTRSGKAITDVVVDATGLKVYGEGEWKVRKHGWGRHRTWMKLHVALDPQDQQAWAVELSTNAVDDAQKVKPLLQAVPCPINGITGDGAYDKVKVREYLCRRAEEQKEDILQLMGLQKNAIRDVKHRGCMRQRDEDIKAIRRLGKRQWKVLSGYHKRSLAETFMFRYKVILGDHLKGRTFENQQTEIKVGAKILNFMLEIAKPESERVA
jgi:hypothetical protein